MGSKESSIRYYWRHKDKIAEKLKQKRLADYDNVLVKEAKYRESVREERKEISRRYYINHREEIRRKAKERRILKRDEVLAKELKYRKANREKVNGYNSKYKEKTRDERRIQHLRLKYGITPDDFYAILESQNFSCAICCTNEIGTGNMGWQIDHCHKTNIVRGILCSFCNKALGGFKDSSEICLRAAKYLEKSKP